MTRAEFTDLVLEAVDALPEEFLQRLENVEIVIEDEPDPDLLRSLGMDSHRETLFGLYQGIPLHLRGSGYSGALPDKITIYYRPLVRSGHTPNQIRAQVRQTVIHEVGHYFGLDDETIRALGH
jgi:predicted Zn-dependent protease with MMP-like domain